MTYGLMLPRKLASAASADARAKRTEVANMFEAYREWRCKSFGLMVV